MSFVKWVKHRGFADDDETDAEVREKFGQVPVIPLADLADVAKEVARRLYDVDRAPVPSTGQPNGWDEEWVMIIARALADAERRGMERAAEIAEETPTIGGCGTENCEDCYGK